MSFQKSMSEINILIFVLSKMATPLSPKRWAFIITCQQKHHAIHHYGNHKCCTDIKNIMQYPYSPMAVVVPGVPVNRADQRRMETH